MFKSEKLVRITLETPEQYISAVTGVIARFKLLHLIRIDETHLGRLGYVAETDGRLLGDYEQFSADLQSALDLLQVRPDGVPTDGEIVPEKEIFKLRERFSELRAVVEAELGELPDLETRLRDKQGLLDRFKTLPAGFDFTSLGRCLFLRWAVGLVPVTGLPKLEESLSDRHHAVIELGTLLERTLIVIFGLKKDWATFERALQGALFEPMAIPEGISGTGGSRFAGPRIANIDRLQEKIQGLTGQRQDFPASIR
ncbi:MAG: hypothetical protein U5R30_20725 [Deltaproteobacteria bacterium]|nr:hypothetical protein [Deltaproteobacteria bacterium]